MSSEDEAKKSLEETAADVELAIMKAIEKSASMGETSQANSNATEKGETRSAAQSDPKSPGTYPGRTSQDEDLADAKLRSQRTRDEAERQRAEEIGTERAPESYNSINREVHKSPGAHHGTPNQDKDLADTKIRSQRTSGEAERQQDEVGAERAPKNSRAKREGEPKTGAPSCCQQTPGAHHETSSKHDNAKMKSQRTRGETERQQAEEAGAERPTMRSHILSNSALAEELQARFDRKMNDKSNTGTSDSGRHHLDFFGSPRPTGDIPNKAPSKDDSTMDVESGEVYPSQAGNSPPKDYATSVQSTPAREQVRAGAVAVAGPGFQDSPFEWPGDTSESEDESEEPKSSRSSGFWRQHLVEARAIESSNHLTTQTAQPVQDRQGDAERIQAKRKRRGLAFFSGALVIMLMAIGLIVGLTLGLSRDKESNVAAYNQTIESPTGMPTMAPTGYVVELPEEMLATLQRDPSSPQAEAYELLLNDPNLANFTQQRLNQRYALIVFYLATGGHNWLAEAKNITQEIQVEDECGWFHSEDFQGMIQPQVTCRCNSTAAASKPEAGPDGGFMGEGCTMPPPPGSPHGGGMQGPPSGPPPGGMQGPPGGMQGPPGPPPGSPNGGGMQGPPGRMLSVDHPEMRQPGGGFPPPNGGPGFPPPRGGPPGGGFPPPGGCHGPPHMMFGNSSQGGFPPVPPGGPMPGQFGQPGGTTSNRLPVVESISMPGNGLDGYLPEQLGLLTNLTELVLVQNPDLQGPFPHKLFRRLTSLERFVVGSTGLQGTLPADLALATSLKEFVLGETQLTGTLPSQLGQMTSLEKLLLQDVAGITGTIPSEIGLMRNLTMLVLVGTSVSGTMPHEVCELTRSGQLESLQVDCNQVSCSAECGCVCLTDAGDSLFDPAGQGGMPSLCY